MKSYKIGIFLKKKYIFTLLEESTIRSTLTYRNLCIYYRQFLLIFVHYTVHKKKSLNLRAFCATDYFEILIDQKKLYYRLLGLEFLSRGSS